MSLVYCMTHNPSGTRPVAHIETAECREAHYVGPAGTEPSMSAIETLDPREAVA